MTLRRRGDGRREGTRLHSGSSSKGIGRPADLERVVQEPLAAAYSSMKGRNMSAKWGALAALCAIALALAGGVSASTKLDGPGTIRITDREIQRARVDVGAAGKSTGDVESSRQQLYNKFITPKPIGHAQIVCT